MEHRKPATAPRRKTVRFLFPPEIHSARTPPQRKAQAVPFERVRKCSFKCPTCDAVFSHYIFLAIHTWSHAPQDIHIPQPRPKPCGVYQSEEKFRLQCFLCPLQFSSDNSLRQHLENCHRNSDEESRLRFPCAFCSMRFPSADILSLHITQHDVWEDGDFYPLFGGTGGKPSATGNEELVSSFDFDGLINELRKIAGEVKSPKRKSSLSLKCKSSSCHGLHYLCGRCSMKFQHGYQVEEHIKLRHKGLLKLLKAHHACAYCKAKFIKLSVLRKHLCEHHLVSVTPRKSAFRV